jgi:hypothetical protein
MREVKEAYRCVFLGRDFTNSSLQSFICNAVECSQNKNLAQYSLTIEGTVHPIPSFSLTSSKSRRMDIVPPSCLPKCSHTVNAVDYFVIADDKGLDRVWVIDLDAARVVSDQIVKPPSQFTNLSHVVSLQVASLSRIQDCFLE